MVRVDEIPQPTGGELEQGGISAVSVQWLQHPRAPIQIIYPAIVIRRSTFIASGQAFSTAPNNVNPQHHRQGIRPAPRPGLG